MSTEPNEVSVIELQRQVWAFAEHTFGAGREDAAWKKLFEELGEVLKKPRDKDEWGDVFILLFDLATVYGVDVADATQGKLDIIKQRVWNRTETGTFQHVPGATKPPPITTYAASFIGGPSDRCTALSVPAGEDAPTAWCPSGHDGPGCYVLLRKDKGLNGGAFYVYSWDATMEYPF